MRTAFVFFFFFISFMSFSQDLILKKDSSKIHCNILKEDRNSIFYTITENGKTIEQSILRTDILGYYNSKAFAQQIKPSDSLIESQKIFVNMNDSLVFISETKFMYNKTKYNLFRVIKNMKGGSEEQLKMERAKNCYVGSTVFGICGGALMGSTMLFLISGHEAAGFEQAGIGIGCIIMAITFDSFYKKNARSALKIFNSKIKVAGINQKIMLDIASSGIGLRLKF